MPMNRSAGSFSMPEIKLLIDTNIIIGLEDAGEVKASFADVVRKCGENGIRVFVHEASRKDVERDKDLARRKATLSKIGKFQFSRAWQCRVSPNWKHSLVLCPNQTT
jgi:hypothetical protein